MLSTRIKSRRVVQVSLPEYLSTWNRFLVVLGMNLLIKSWAELLINPSDRQWIKAYAPNWKREFSPDTRLSMSGFLLLMGKHIRLTQKISHFRLPAAKFSEKPLKWPHRSCLNRLLILP